MTMAALQPCPTAVLRNEIGRLWAVTIRRETNQQDIAAISAFYKEGLARYPVDIVVSVLRRPRKWWPALAELTDEMDALVERRRLIERALREAGTARKVVALPKKPEWEPPTEDDKRAVDQLVAAAIGNVQRRSERPMEREPMSPAARQQMENELAQFRARWNEGT